ncbi:MAG: hypothetical protein A2171_02770 [Candidatus Levybacteria bacterium RBG_13_35_9]|nr:MAG: hypothetical protein A2171_02770 [Candidatus Levybacteria bacterium RBG_13_35_9]
MTGVFEFIEDYLIRDLKSMRSLKSQDGLGKCGYQMMISLCSACEILGSLEKNEFNQSGGNERFKFFLEKHLPEYVSSWEILYYFIRHRVAHDFITPPGIAIRLKNDRARHLGLIDDWFVVDAYVFMDDFISTYEQIKEQYNQESVYKKLLDDGYTLLIQFIKDRSNELSEKISQSNFKHLEYPAEEAVNNVNTAVPSGAAFEFDKSNFTRIPDDMLEKMNSAIKNTAASSASGSTIEDKDIKPLK